MGYTSGMGEVFYEEVFRALNRQGVRYLVVGGVAVNLLGVPRMTKDLDLMLDLEDDNLKRFVSAAKELGYRPRAPVSLDEFEDAAKRASWRAAGGRGHRDLRRFHRRPDPHESSSRPAARQIGHRHAAQGAG